MPHTLPLASAHSIAFESIEELRTLQAATPHTFTATAAPVQITSPDGETLTQVVSTALTGTDSYDYLGCWVVPESGLERGQARQIVAFIPADDAISVHPAWDTAPANGTMFRMWRPAESVVRAVSNTATLVTADATADAAGTPARDEAVGFWSDDGADATIGADRYALWCRSPGVGGQSNFERMALITNDAAVAASQKVFTSPAASWNVVASGQLFVIRKLINQSDGSIVLPDHAREILERPVMRGVAGRGATQPHALGRRLPGGDLSLSLELQPSAQGSAGGETTVARAPNEAGDLLRSIFDVESDPSSTLVGAQTTTVISVTTGAEGTFVPGNIILVEGEAAQILQMADGGAGVEDTLSIFPALTAAPQATRTVFGGVNFIPKLTGFRSHTVEAFPGGRRIQAVGWIPNLSIQGVVGGSIPSLQFSGPFDTYIDDGLTYPDAPVTHPGGDAFPINQVEVPVLSEGGRIVLVEVDDDTSVANYLTSAASQIVLDHAVEFTLDVGYSFVRNPNRRGFAGGDGIVIGNPARNTTGTLKVFAPNDFSYLRRLQAGHRLALFIQLGTEVRAGSGGSGGTFCIAMPRIQITGAPLADEEGRLSHTLTFATRETSINMTDNTFTAPATQVTTTSRLRDLTLTWL